LIDVYEHKVGPRNGARVVARAWVDPVFKERLLENGTAAVGEFGYSGNQGADIRVVENTPTVHNIVVCTVLVLPLARFGTTAHLVQIRAVSCRLIRSPRSASSSTSRALMDARSSPSGAA
jgi:nitrile hydratase